MAWDRSTPSGVSYSPSVNSGGRASSESTSSSNSTSNSQQSSFTGISNEEALNTLMSYIKESANGGSASFRQQAAARSGVLADTKQLQGEYSRDMAFQDAAMLIQQSLQKSMEANMPAISRAVAGAGTSANSMQGLLSQRLASDAAQSAGALGAQQAVSYGNIQANLAATLEALSRVNTEGDTNLIKALELLRNSSSQGTSSSQQTSNSQQVSGSQPLSLSSEGSGSSPFSTVSGSGGSSGDSYIYQPYNLTNSNAQDAYDRYLWD